MAPRYDVREVLDRGHYWQVVYDLTMDDGTLTEHGHSIPKETLEWRAAEYDFDPDTDLETILDVVLSEPYIAEEDRAEGEELHDAPDIATARAMHVSRCAKAKLRHRISTRNKPAEPGARGVQDHPLDMIRNDCVMDKTVIAVKKEHVRLVRLENARQARENRQERDTRRAERIAEELNVDLDAVKKNMRGKSNG